MTDTTTQDVVETPALDADETVTPEIQADEPVSASSPDAIDADDSSEPRKGVQKRIDELTRNWREAERREAALLDMLQRNNPAPPEPQQPVESVTPSPVKTLADFNHDEAQFAAYLEQRVADRAERTAREVLQREREAETTRRREESFRARVDAFRKDAPDFDDLVLRNRSLPISAGMAALIHDSEDGPAVAYHLGKNPSESARIAALPPMEAARELGKIEARISFEREQAKKVVATPKPAVSQAPPPPPRIDAVDAAPRVSTTSADSDKLSDDEWVKAELARLNRKAKRNV